MLIHGHRDAGPFIHLHSGDKLISAIFEAEDRSLALFHVKPILAERIDNVRLVRDKNAIVMAVVMNTIGAMAGTAVAATVGKGIVAPSALTVPAIAATMISIIGWGSLAARLGIPVSKSHALLAGLAGAGFAGGGWEALQRAGWEKVIMGLVSSLFVGFAGAFALGRIIIALAAKASPTRAKRNFDRAQMASAAFWPSIMASTTARSSWACSR